MRKSVKVLGVTALLAVCVAIGAADLGQQTGAVAAGTAGTKPVTVVHLNHSPMHAQANHLTGKVLAHGKSAKDVVKVNAFSDGCDHSYGVTGQCIPLRAPGDKAVTCAYLKSAGFLSHGGLLVRKDHLHLMKTGQTRTTKSGDVLTSC